jgi:hypothetical protein
MYRVGWYSGKLVRCLVRISAGTPDIPPKVLRDFHHSLEANAWIVPLVGQDRFLPNSFQFISLSNRAM